MLNRQTIEVQTGNFSSWWENKKRKKRLKEIRKLRRAAAQTSQWADKNERTKIGFDPIKERWCMVYSYIYE